MIASMAFFASADSLVKVATSSLSPAQVTFYLMAGGLLVFGIPTKCLGYRFLDHRALKPLLLIRYLAEMLGLVGMVTALAYVPLSTVGAVTQATPLLAALGAVLFLGEQIGWRRWMCIGAGFVGVLLIVQPVDTGFDASVLWAVLALVALSTRDLTTRLAPADISSLQLATFTMLAAAPMALVWVLARGESPLPAATNWAIVLPMIVLGSVGYLLLILSLRVAEVSVVMPFRFSRIVFLLALGIMIFGERPDWFMLLGVMIIVLAGAYMMRRESLIKRRESR